MRDILIHPDLKKQIAKEFKCTYYSVTMSIKGVFKSEQAHKILARAEQLLVEEIDKIKKALENEEN